jgi:hypothetical protein
MAMDLADYYGSTVRPPLKQPGLVAKAELGRLLTQF